MADATVTSNDPEESPALSSETTDRSSEAAADSSEPAAPSSGPAAPSSEPAAPSSGPAAPSVGSNSSATATSEERRTPLPENLRLAQYMTSAESAHPISRFADHWEVLGLARRALSHSAQWLTVHAFSRSIYSILFWPIS